MVAYRLHFEEANLRAIKLVQSGKIGDLRYFQSAFSLPVQDPDNIRLQHETGGGPLWDIGIYCINAVRNLYQAEPIQVFATTAGKGKGKFKEVEEVSAVVLRFPDERIASFICSFGASDVSEFRIVGSKGQLRLTSAYEYVEPITHYLTLNGKERKQTFAKRDQFAALLLQFSNCILQDTVPEPTGDEGLHDVRIIQALYRSAKEGRPVSLGESDRKRRPTFRQAIRRPPVKKPGLIHAKSPSG
jgi:glucose-fructose oxidoreductase